MANGLSPTAANIISSLGIKGAISEIPAGVSASAFAGFLPVLNEEGKLDAQMISARAAQEALPTTTNVAFVDQSVASGTAKTGSIVAPYGTIAEAAANSAARNGESLVIILSPGSHAGGTATFATYPNGNRLGRLYIIGLGLCSLTGSLTIEGLASGAAVFFVDMYVSGNNTVTITSSAPHVSCLGSSQIGVLNGPQGDVNSSLLLSPESRVSSTNIENIDFTADAEHIKYSNGTVADTLDRLDARRIRIAKITAGSSGFVIDGSSYLAAESGSSFEAYDLFNHDKRIVEGVNKYVKAGRNLDVDTITADKVTAGVVETDELKMSYLTLGGYRIEIDPYGYLVVTDSADSPVAPPKNLLLLEDSVTHIIYGIGIASGRAYAVNLEDESSSYSGAVTVLHVTEDGTGNVYDLTMEDGRLIIRPHVGE